MRHLLEWFNENDSLYSDNYTQIHFSMRALILDDEHWRAVLKLLEDHPSIEVVGEAANADEALNDQRIKPDLLFLDIQMPGKTGFQLLEDLDAVPLVVFTTAYDEFALKAFEVSALDYLLKPIQPERLAETMAKVAEKERVRNVATRTEGDKKLGLNDQVFVKDGALLVRKPVKHPLFESDATTSGSSTATGDDPQIIKCVG